MTTQDKAKLGMFVFGAIAVINFVNVFIYKLPTFVIILGLLICIIGTIWIVIEFVQGLDDD